MKFLHKVLKQLIWVWNEGKRYEKNAWRCEKYDKCYETNAPLKDARPPRNRLCLPWCFSASISVPNPSMHSRHWNTNRGMMYLCAQCRLDWLEPLGEIVEWTIINFFLCPRLYSKRLFFGRELYSKQLFLRMFHTNKRFFHSTGGLFRTIVNGTLFLLLLHGLLEFCQVIVLVFHAYVYTKPSTKYLYHNQK